MNLVYLLLNSIQLIYEAPVHHKGSTKNMREKQGHPRGLKDETEKSMAGAKTEQQGGLVCSWLLWLHNNQEAAGQCHDDLQQTARSGTSPLLTAPF